MSYFFATVGGGQGRNESLKYYFDHVTGNATNSTIDEKGLNVTYYAESKKIEDIFIRDDETRSWLLLLGMPLLGGQTALATVLHEFLCDPAAILNEIFDGHYCLFAFDANAEKVFVATDSNSFIPVFYKDTEGGFIISSSELALAKATNAPIDRLGFSQSISLGVVWGEQTRFKGIKKLRACELLTIQSHAASIERYWSPKGRGIWNESKEIIIERWADVAVRGLEQMIQQADSSKVTADITGGEDSRLVLALCHSLGVPVSSLRVRGISNDLDVRIAKEVSERLGIQLDVEYYREVGPSLLENGLVDISLETDGYGSIFPSLSRHFTDEYTNGPRERNSLHLCGVPGGEAYRGSYYLRAKLLNPSKMNNLDIPFFIRMKFLLDHIPGLFQVSNEEFIEAVNRHVNDALEDVKDYPAGTKVDHLLRVLQTSVFGLTLRQPFYLPLGLRDITKTIYSVSPRLKRGGRLTKACTERLYPELAWIKTHKGVPTVRRTMLRSYLFLPEVYAQLRTIVGGVKRRVLHIDQGSAKLNIRHQSEYHAATMRYILNEGETGKWFKSHETMTTGHLYDPEKLSSLLAEAKQGQCSYVDILGRIINAELALQYVADL